MLNFVQPKRRLKSLWTNHVFFVICKLIITMPFKNVSSVSCDIYRCSKNCSQSIIICNRISICKISIDHIALTPAVQCNYLKGWSHNLFYRKQIVGPSLQSDHGWSSSFWLQPYKICVTKNYQNRISPIKEFNDLIILFGVSFDEIYCIDK